MLFLMLLHATVATCKYYQVATLRKIYYYLTGSSGLEIWNQQNRKPCLACNDKSNFTTIHRVALVSFLLIQELMGLCNIKNPKRRKRNGFKHLGDNKRFFYVR